MVVQSTDFSLPFGLLSVADTADCISQTQIPLSLCRSGDGSNITSMLAPQAERVMALQEWEERWSEGRTGFHQLDVNR